MRSYGPCQQNILHSNVAVKRGEREFRIHRRHTGVEKEWYGTMDDSGVIVLIRTLGDAKIAHKWVMNTHSHYHFAPNIK